MRLSHATVLPERFNYHENNVVLLPMDSSFLLSKMSAKFQWGHPERGRQIEVGRLKAAIFDQYLESHYFSDTMQVLTGTYLLWKEACVPELSYGVVCVILFLPFGTIPVCDGMTDSSVSARPSRQAGHYWSVCVQVRSVITQSILLANKIIRTSA